MNRYSMMIGLEVHIELRTRTKMFCSCRADFGGEPNTKICPVCAGYPGMLPVVNRDAVIKGLILAKELHGNISRISRFDRKNYFYPDNPKSYQITQHYQPLSLGGGLKVGERWIRIHEIHLEEDAGKLIHTSDGRTLVNLNRAGVPLAEIVTEPDFESPDEVTAFLEILRDIAVYSGISDGRMQEGSLRADVNLSLKDNVNNVYGTRTEMKNLNSFTEIRHAIQHEASRQETLLMQGKPVIRETRRWDEDRRESFSMRGKEDAPDYRYFPDPDLPPVIISDEWLESVRASLPEMHDAKLERYVTELKLPEYTLEEEAKRFLRTFSSIDENEKEYLKGKQYLLFMSKNESVFYEKQFYSCGRSVYQTERGLFADSIKGLDKMTEKDILEAVKQQVRVTKYRTEAPIRDAYIHSDDKELIFREAAFVVKGLVKAVEQTADDRVMATVKIEYAYKGSLSGTIRAIVPLGAVEIGQSYILALSAADSLFVIAAPHSVYPPSEENIDLLSRCYGTN